MNKLFISIYVYIHCKSAELNIYINCIVKIAIVLLLNAAQGDFVDTVFGSFFAETIELLF